MLQGFIQSFVRAWGRGLGYQAARTTGWILVPVLVIIVGAIMLAELFGWRVIDKLPFLKNLI